MTKKITLISLMFLLLLPTFAQKNGHKLALPSLPKELKISYPKSNPLKKALQPVPKSAIFKMEGYYLWDPSVIKVGDTITFFVPAGLKRME